MRTLSNIKRKTHYYRYQMRHAKTKNSASWYYNQMTHLQIGLKLLKSNNIK